MKSHRMLRCHFVAISIEAIGTFFIFLESFRLNEIATDKGVSLGTPKGYEGIIYHLGVPGFAFLFVGLMAQFLIIFSEHANIELIHDRIGTVEKDLSTLKGRIKASEAENDSCDSP